MPLLLRTSLKQENDAGGSVLYSRSAQEEFRIKPTNESPVLALVSPIVVFLSLPSAERLRRACDKEGGIWRRSRSGSVSTSMASKRPANGQQKQRVFLSQ